MNKVQLKEKLTELAFESAEGTNAVLNIMDAVVDRAEKRELYELNREIVKNAPHYAERVIRVFVNNCDEWGILEILREELQYRL